MNRFAFAFACIALVGLTGLSRVVAAQDLVITNARIIDATGSVIERGNIVVRSGRIASVSSEATAPGLTEIDADGMTAMPGFIDAHRHIMGGDDDQWFMEQSVVRMQEFLDAGFTTLMSGGGPVPGIVELKRRIDEGELPGPRIVTSGRANSINNTPARARDEVRIAADAGVEIIKTSIDVIPTAAQIETLAAIIDEGRQHGLDTMVHAVSVQSMVAAVEAGAARLVHTPTRGEVSDSDARIVSDAGVSITSTVGIWIPIYGEDNAPLWRDGTPFPAEAVVRAGLGPVNARHLWDAGVTVAFGTDTAFLPKDSLAHELVGLKLLFSPLDIVTLMGPNTATFIDMGSDLGTLAPGKLADIVLIDGDPLDDVSHLLDVVVVVKGGEIVADHRP